MEAEARCILQLALVSAIATMANSVTDGLSKSEIIGAVLAAVDQMERGIDAEQIDEIEAHAMRLTDMITAAQAKTVH